MADKNFYSNKGPYKLSEISKMLGIPVLNSVGDPVVQDISTLLSATPESISFLNSANHIKELQSCKAQVLIVGARFKKHAEDRKNIILTETPQKILAQVIHMFYPDPDAFDRYPVSSGVSGKAIIGNNVKICAGASVSENAEISDDTIIGPGSFIGPGVKIGNGCHIHANVTITQSIIGNKVVVYPGAVIGRAGFGFAMEKTGPVDVPQIGRAIIEDNVHVGANTTIDRGALDDTVIGAGTRIDNLVQIAHNAKTGKGCIIVSQAGIAGSTELGDYCALGGQVGLAGHIKIGTGAQVAAKSGVMHDIKEGEIVGGIPSMPFLQWKRSCVAVAKLGQKKKD